MFRFRGFDRTTRTTPGSAPDNKTSYSLTFSPIQGKLLGLSCQLKCVVKQRKQKTPGPVSVTLPTITRIYKLSLLVPHSSSTWSIGLFFVSFYLFLSIAILAASVHVLNSVSHLALSTVLLQVSLGRPLFLLPSGAHVSAVLGNESGFILNT